MENNHKTLNSSNSKRDQIKYNSLNDNTKTKVKEADELSLEDGEIYINIDQHNSNQS